MNTMKIHHLATGFHGDAHDVRRQWTKNAAATAANVVVDAIDVRP
jgi:hypothetical protein